MRVRISTICNTRSVGHFLHCNGGESLSRKRFLHTLPSAAHKEVLCLLNLSGTNTGPAPYVSVLKALGSYKALQEGKCIHHLIVSSALDLDTFVVAYLVRMYGACGAFGDAFALFSEMQERSVFSFNFLIRACARHSENEKVLVLLQQMMQEGIVPSKVTFVSVFDACASLTDFDAGHRMHALIVNGHLEVDVVVGTALVNMYGSYGNIAGAWLCFHRLSERDVIAWTALISALSHQACGKEAFCSFEEMLQESILPNEVTFISLCGACANYTNVSNGERVHVRVQSLNAEANVVLGNALITMYGKCGALKPAETIFKTMTDRSLFSWTAIVSAYSHHGLCKEACQHFFHILQLGILPDNVLFTTILATCASSSLLSVCKHMHVMVLMRNPVMDAVIGTALVNTYGKCQDVRSAKETFDSFADHNVYSWNALIVAFTQKTEDLLVDKLYNQMQEEGILPNKVTFVCIFDACGNNRFSFKRGVQLHACINQQELEVQNALIDMYGKNGKLEVAQSIFDTTIKRDSITWTVLITAYVQHGQMMEALCLFARLCKEGLQPDAATFVSILSACYSKRALVTGQQIHAFIFERSVESDTMVGTALVSMYGRCDSVEDARMVFDRISRCSEIAWNAMISIHEQAGQAKEALDLFGNMQYDRVSPDDVTFVTILSACIAQFALEEGRIVHAYIIESGCVVDVVLASAIVNIYGKSGSLEDAHGVFYKIQDRNVVTWNTMIALHAQHGLALEALAVFSQMQVAGMIPNHITFVNILGACSHCGFLYEACFYFVLMGQGYMLFPTVDIYVCLIDLFGRAGCLNEAEAVVKGMPVLPSSVTFMALLGACRYRDDVERGTSATKHASEIEPGNLAPCLVLSNLYAAVGRMDNAALVMSLFVDGIVESGSFTDEEDLHDMYLQV
ncbi:hypothetical protein GOP47_0008962 [Adiantum capillus-veneris]|uniref:Pentatricopeptide repeat-containing protein n=1 Tax=Adiantum capillus-veneris TaxID=13818 RepID=A0A9D4ZK77_ADICA|nr:hypothetical protein GOP47_0008962 [Adiantum capillus-veneris]